MRGSLLVVLAALILFATPVISIRAQPSQQVGSVIQNTVDNLNIAYLDGANSRQVQAIVSQLNYVLLLQDEANASARAGDSAAVANLFARATNIARQAQSEATTLTQSASLSSLEGKLFAWALVPALALASTLLYLRGLSWHEQRKGRKLLRMVVRLKEKKEEK